MGGHNAHYGGPRVLVGCSLGALKYVYAHARPATSCECARGPPLPAPPRAPPPSAPLWGRAVSGLWAACFFSGSAPPCAPSPPLLDRSRRLVAPPPVPPSGIMCSCLLWCSVRSWLVCPSFLFYSGRFGGGVRGPSVSFRPPRCRSDGGRPPMSPAPRPRPRLLCACGHGVRPRGHLAGRGPVRFKWPRARTPCPLAIA